MKRRVVITRPNGSTFVQDVDARGGAVELVDQIRSELRTASRSPLCSGFTVVLHATGEECHHEVTR